ncbi:MAG: alpha/beta hydrolase [Thermonemataceae bacterium]
MKRLFFLIIGVAFILYISAVSWLLFRQDEIIFSVQAEKSSVQLPHRKIEFKNREDVLAGCIIPAVGERKQWVIFCHGAETTLYAKGHQARYNTWHKLNLNVLTFDYLGYGKSQGEPSELGMYESARAAYHYLSNVELVDESDIIIYGEGLGVSVALDLARQVNVAGVVLENGITSLIDLCQETYPLMPMHLIFKSTFDARTRINAVVAPKLFIYASDNQKIASIHTQQLYDISLQPKAIKFVEGGHHDAISSDSLNYQRILRTFLQTIRWK